jgi:glycosyltransferase involved in cell wall biosynthesis
METRSKYSDRKRIAFLSTYKPRECGIATFTKDLVDALDQLNEFRPARIIAMNEKDTIYNYDDKVRWQIEQNSIEEYLQVASLVNSSKIDLVSLQHEFGIFGGEWGEYLVSFLEHIQKPVVTTLHSVQPDFDSKAAAVLKAIASRSVSIVVMAHAALGILQKYGVPRGKINVVQHGVPDIPFVPSDKVKPSLGLKGRKVLSTFGLISAGKGIEYVIQALPSIIDKQPGVLYLIIGVTHPEVRKIEGEQYRMNLIKLVDELGLKNHVRFHNRFLTKRELTEYLQATDIYITPYISPNQISSGTLVAALAAGRATVSTPYLHAKEVLADGRGLLCEFKNPESIASNVNKLLANETLRRSMEKRVYKYSRNFVWSKVAEKYASIFKKVIKT